MKTKLVCPIYVYSLTGIVLSVAFLFAWNSSFASDVASSLKPILGETFTETSTNDFDDRETLVVSQNYPNPFNAGTEISLILVEATDLKVQIFNVLGQRIVTLYDGFATAGTHNIYWDGKNVRGKDVSSGIYFYRIIAGDASQTKKMILLK